VGTLPNWLVDLAFAGLISRGVLAQVEPQFVREAGRLLQTSIIEVETPDILLAFEESRKATPSIDEQQVSVTADGDDQQQQQAAADGDDDSMDQESGTGASASAIGNGSNGRQHDSMTVARPRERRVPKKKTTVAMTYERYQQLKTLVIMRLHSIDPDGFGIPQKELVKWLVEQTHEPKADMAGEVRLLTSFVNRLLAGGDVLIEPQEHSIDSGTHKRLLALHPNVDTQSF
jgi:hypothetical protein